MPSQEDGVVRAKKFRFKNFARIEREKTLKIDRAQKTVGLPDAPVAVAYFLPSDVIECTCRHAAFLLYQLTDGVLTNHGVAYRSPIAISTAPPCRWMDHHLHHNSPHNMLMSFIFNIERY